MTTEDQKLQNAKIIIAMLALLAAFVICGSIDYRNAQATQAAEERVK